MGCPEANKTPLGCIPRKIHRQERMRDLAGAIHRRLEHEIMVTDEGAQYLRKWVDELNSLIDDHLAEP